jgi:hypothetical protein
VSNGHSADATPNCEDLSSKHCNNQRRKDLVNLDQELGGLPVPHSATGSILRQLVKKGLVERPIQPLNGLGNARITAYALRHTYDAIVEALRPTCRPCTACAFRETPPRPLTPAMQSVSRLRIRHLGRVVGRARAGAAGRAQEDRVLDDSFAAQLYRDGSTGRATMLTIPVVAEVSAVLATRRTSALAVDTGETLAVRQRCLPFHPLPRWHGAMRRLS